MARINEIIAEVSKFNSSPDIWIIQQAYVFAAKNHSGQIRNSGEPYLTHPLETAFILAKMQMDEAVIVAGILHDTVEDCPDVKIEEVKEVFGEEIAELVNGVTKISKMKFKSRAVQQAENFKKILLATAKDIRVIFIKLADRLHNMRTLEYVNSKKRGRIARETREIYAPLAHRLGMQWIKNELEDLAFRYLNSKAYYDIVLRLSKGRRERENYIEEVQQVLKDLLKKHNIESTNIYGRVKNIHSIWKKMIAQSLEFEQIPDILAFRIILDSIPECYEVMGIIHSIWKPVPGRFKDYIALPKNNRYQSLHTTVIGPYGERIEVQMRTIEMNRFAEEGVAAHWRYKEGGAQDEKADKKISWLKKVFEWYKEADDSEDFLDLFKVDLFPDEVCVFTPNGDVHSFPKGATPIDFAYKIHTEVGHKCAGAKVNEQIVALDYQLKSGDRIEIITKEDHVPSRDWLKLVHTGTAKAKIRNWIKIQQHEQSFIAGKALAEKELRRYKMSFSKAEKDGHFETAAEKMGFKNVDNMIAALGYGKLSMTAFLQEVVPEDKQTGDLKPKENALDRILRPIIQRQRSGIKIENIDNVLFRLARCCSPLPGEKVIGFVTRGRGITVHTVDCSELGSLDEERKVEVDWDLSDKKAIQRAQINLEVRNSTGMLAEISNIIASQKVNIADVVTQDQKDIGILLSFIVEVTGIEELSRLMKKLEKVKGVIKVSRIKRAL